jgi:hypothetical protein
VLKKFQFDTFYHEHPRTYSLTSFTYIAALLDCAIIRVEFPSRYNGNIRIFFEKKNVNILTSLWKNGWMKKKIDMKSKIRFNY